MYILVQWVKFLWFLNKSYRYQISDFVRVRLCFNTCLQYSPREHCLNYSHVLDSTGLPDFPTPSLPNTATWTFLTLEVVPFFLLLTIGLLIGSRSLAVEYEYFS